MSLGRLTPSPKISRILGTEALASRAGHIVAASLQAAQLVIMFWGQAAVPASGGML